MSTDSKESVDQSLTFPRAIAEGAAMGGKFLTFVLAGEEFGIEIAKIQEIIAMTPITPVPRAPHYIRGVINLRGKVMRVVDLRLKLGMDEHRQTAQTCIIVVHAAGTDMGLVVDRVSDVLDIAGRDIEDAPSFGADVDYILGIGKETGRVRLLLDIERILSVQDVVEISAPAAG